MSAGSRSTRGGQHGARGTNAAAWFYGPQGFGSTRGNVPSAPAVESRGQDSAKADPLLWEEFLSLPFVPCPGPAGTWPCSLAFGHPNGEEDHQRFAPESK